MSGPPRLPLGLTAEEARTADYEARLGVALGLLTRPLGQGVLWNAEGPTRKAEELRAAKRLDPATKVLVEAAWAIWSQECNPGLVDLQRGLRREDAIQLHSLLTAIAGGDLEFWISGRTLRARHA